MCIYIYTHKPNPAVLLKYTEILIKKEEQSTGKSPWLLETFSAG